MTTRTDRGIPPYRIRRVTFTARTGQQRRLWCLVCRKCGNAHWFDRTHAGIIAFLLNHRKQHWDIPARVANYPDGPITMGARGETAYGGPGPVGSRHVGGNWAAGRT